MGNIMKIKNYTSQFIAMLTLVFLVSGFQLSSETTISGLLTNESEIIANEAYAGPCGRAGCDGEPLYCKPVVVLSIGSIDMIKHCKGTPPEKQDEDIQSI
jgi:hypothetical protein